MIRPAEERDATTLAELMTQLGYPTMALVVHEQTRGRGIGRELLAAAEEYFSRGKSRVLF